MENLHRDLFKEREGQREKEQEQRSETQVSEDRWGDSGEPLRDFSKERDRGEERSEQQVSEDRWGDREWTTYIGMSQKRGEERKMETAEI